MKRFVSFFAIFMVALSYLILTALIGYSLRQSWNTKEVTTTAEIIEILEADFTQIKTTRITNAVVLCQYSYEGKEYKKETSIDSGCKKGDIIDIVIDADNPDVIINFTKQEKKVCFLFVRVWTNAEPRILTYACLTKTVCRLKKRSGRFSRKFFDFLFLIC